MAFFFGFSKMYVCLKDIAENHSKNLVLIKNLNKVSKKKEESKEKSQKKQYKTIFFSKS